MAKNDLLLKVAEFTGCSDPKYMMSLKEIFELDAEMTEEWYVGKHRDLAFYDSFEYVWIAARCYQSFSKGYIAGIHKVLGEQGIKRILDFGAGVGATTRLMAELWPKAVVYYQNLPGKQYEFARLWCAGCKSILWVEEVEEIKEPVDMIFCLELFEHIKAPIEALDKLLALKPKYVITSNSFTLLRIGHWEEFDCEGGVVKAKDMNRLFTAEMTRRGYHGETQVERREFWQGRPRIWRRIK